MLPAASPITASIRTATPDDTIDWWRLPHFATRWNTVGRFASIALCSR
jgi:hypothetical protein